MWKSADDPAQLFHRMLPEFRNLFICIGEINFFSELLIRNIIHGTICEIYQGQKLLDTAVHVMAIDLGEEFSVE